MEKEEKQEEITMILICIISRIVLDLKFNRIFF